MLKQRYDVVVVGAGAAGIAAAMTSARSGQSTLLIEAGKFPGGTVVKGAITTLCGLYTSTGPAAPRLIYTGFPAEFAWDLMKMDRVGSPLRMGKLYVLPFRPESFQALAMDLLGRQQGLQAVFAAGLIGVDQAHSRIESLRIRLRGRVEAVEVGAVIDCSGNAAAARLAGHALLEADDFSQAPAVLIPVRNVTGGLGPAARRIQILLALQRAVTAGRLPKAAGAVVFMPTLVQDAVVLKLNLGLGADRRETSPLRLAEQAEELARALLAFLQKHVAEFAHCRTENKRFPLLHRSSARIVGKEMLKGADILQPGPCLDPASQGCWPIEKWDQEGRQSLRHPPAGTCYSIPKGALQARDVDNLFMAGKCLSADDDAVASARVIGCCLATGEAAGRLASDFLSSNSN